MNSKVTNRTTKHTQDAQQSKRTLNSDAVGGTNTKVNGADIKHVGLKVTGKEGKTKLNALLKNVDTVNTCAVNGNGVTVVNTKINTTGIELS